MRRVLYNLHLVLGLTAQLLAPAAARAAGEATPTRGVAGAIECFRLFRLGQGTSKQRLEHIKAAKTVPAALRLLQFLN